jgi:hypothetical protein
LSDVVRDVGIALYRLGLRRELVREQEKAMNQAYWAIARAELCAANEGTVRCA